MSLPPAVPAEPFEAEPPSAIDGRSVLQADVRFTIPTADGWPPGGTERVSAEVLGEDEFRLVEVPLYVEAVSAGDVVRIHAGGEAGAVVRRGRHSTVRVVAATASELDEPRLLVEQLGCATRTGTVPPVLAIDVPERVAIEDVLVLLDARCSMTLTYSVTCLQHRITPLSPADVTAAAARRTRPGDADPTQARPEPLDLQVRGRVVRPGDEAWDSARAAWNLAVDQRPALVVEVADAFDVQAVVRFAGQNGLRVAPQGTGHNAAPLGDLADAILLRTGRLDAVDVDATARVVRVGAGVVWAAVADALAPHGLAALAGSSPDVGVVGYTLGGGYSWLGRRHGLAGSSVRAVELVTADAAFHQVDATTDPDLFWAVRGGGANVGVVCALELDVHPVPDVYAGALMFPLTRASEILRAYEEWTRDLDESATTCVRLIRVPARPDLPEPLQGKAFVMIDGAIDASDTAAVDLLAPLRGLGPVLDSFARMPTSELSDIHMDPPEPVPGVGDGVALAHLTQETIDVLLEHVGPESDTGLLAVDLRHLGGALGRPDPRGGAIDHLPGRFLLFAVGIAPSPESVVALGTQVAALVEDLQPWASPVDYLNFRERAVAPGRLYPMATLDKLRAVCDAADPGRILLANHPIG